MGPTAQDGAITGAIPGAIPGRVGAERAKGLLQGRCGGGEGVKKAERKEAKSVVGGTAAVSRGVRKPRGIGIEKRDWQLR